MTAETPRGTGSDLPVPMEPAVRSVPVPVPVSPVTVPVAGFRQRSRLVAGLVGAAALVVVLAALGAVALLGSHGTSGGPAHPVAVTSQQPSARPSSPRATAGPDTTGAVIGNQPSANQSATRPAPPPAQQPGYDPTSTPGTIGMIGPGR